MTQHFSYQDDTLTIDGVSLKELAIEYGTPLYVYSKKAIVENFRQYADTCNRFESDKIHSLVCYSVKSNSNPGHSEHSGQQGAGFDIVSGGDCKE